MTSLLVLLAVSGACGNRADAPRPQARPIDVVLISLDTYRWDALGLNRREDRSLTPNLDRFGREAVNFTSTFVQMPHTLASHASIFTGLYPDVHRALTRASPLPATVPTLAEVLRQAGYQTAGIVSCTWFEEKFGLDQGFEIYEVISNLDHYTSAAEVNDRSFELLDGWRLPNGAPGEQPLFLFLHYYEAHSDIGQELPYWAPDRYRHTDTLDESGFCDREGNCATEYLLAADREGREMSTAEIRAIHDLYLAGVEYLDAELGRLFERLRDRGLYDDALIVLASDHGEEFREHGRFIHAQIYDETIQVPLLMRFPGGEYGGRTVPALAETTDILPTVLDVLEVSAPAAVQGTSLYSVLAGADTRREVFSQGKGHTRLYALRTAEYKLLHDFETGKTELYDVRSDPREQFDLSADDTETTRRLKRRLIRRVTKNRELARELHSNARPTVETDLSPEEIERLESLGYLK